MNRIHNFMGSGFLTGYIPFASGTWGSAAALLIYWFVPGMENWKILLPMSVVISIYGFYVGDLFEMKFGKDPAECTIDEVAGMWISLMFLPKSILIAVITFFIWRVIDIVKPAPARQAEALKGGYGIMMDDIIGGVYTCLIMNGLILFTPLGKHI